MRLTIEVDEDKAIATLKLELDGQVHMTTLNDDESERLGKWFESLDDTVFVTVAPEPA